MDARKFASKRKYTHLLLVLDAKLAEEKYRAVFALPNFCCFRVVLHSTMVDWQSENEHKRTTFHATVEHTIVSD